MGSVLFGVVGIWRTALAEVDWVVQPLEGVSLRSRGL